MTLEFKNSIPYDIKIIPSHNGGFIVRAGCSVTVFETADNMLAAIKEFVDDPESVEGRFNARDGRNFCTDIPVSSGRAAICGDTCVSESSC